MARKPRIHYYGAIYHLMMRGNAKQNIFFDDSDKHKLALLLQEGVEKYYCKIHAFCFMNNHFHLAIQVTDIPLSHFVQNIAFRYAQWINKRYERVGHVFQGRFKAILIDTDAYLKVLVRYIHLNPFRAKLVDSPEFPWWSSHSDYLNNCKNHEWITTELVLSQFHEIPQKARSLYRNFIHDGLLEKSLPSLSVGNVDQRVLGDSDFLVKIMKITKETFSKKITQEKVMEFICLTYQLTEEDLCSQSRARKYSEPRAVFVWLVNKFKIMSLTKAALVFQKEPASFTRKLQQIEKKKPFLLAEFNKSISQA